MADRRLFFALWPDESVRQQIESADFLRLPQNTTPRAHWHMTLVFLGHTQADQQCDLEQAAAIIDAAAFDLQLDSTGEFSGAGIGYLGCDQSNPALLSFQNSLESTLRDCCHLHPAFGGVRRAFCPHITLYRHIKKYPQARLSIPINWRVESFSLIESRHGKQAVYRELNRWKLSD